MASRHKRAFLGAATDSTPAAPAYVNGSLKGEVELGRQNVEDVSTSELLPVALVEGENVARSRELRRFHWCYAYHKWSCSAASRCATRACSAGESGELEGDFKDYLETGIANQVPPLIVKTTYMWTASDPAYAAVNGEDLLPDIALGRLAASSVGEAEENGR